MGFAVRDKGYLCENPNHIEVVETLEELKNNPREKIRIVEVPVEIIKEIIREPINQGYYSTEKKLKLHPNFKFPITEPDIDSLDEIIVYIFDAIANFISPPKTPDENEDFACEDVAAAIEYYLKPEIIKRLKEIYSRELFKPKKRKINLE